MIQSSSSKIFTNNFDTEYYKLSSINSYFFEMFNKKNIKCKLKLFNTLVFEDSKPYLWLFNSV